MPFGDVKPGLESSRFTKMNSGTFFSIYRLSHKKIADLDYIIISPQNNCNWVFFVNDWLIFYINYEKLNLLHSEISQCNRAVYLDFMIDLLKHESIKWASVWLKGFIHKINIKKYI